jgi:hypothetical protein
MTPYLGLNINEVKLYSKKSERKEEKEKHEIKGNNSREEKDTM